MKACSACGETKPADEFYRRGDKLRAACKVCTNAQNREWHRRNPHKQLEYDKRFAQSKPDQAKARTRRWREKNPDKVRQASQNRKRGPNRKRNREYDREYARAWNAANPGKRRLTQHKYRARKMANKVGNVSLQEARAILNRACMYCGGVAEHLDHVVPISRGGAHSVGNLAPACASCNLSKRNRFVIEWKAWKLRDIRNHLSLQDRTG